MPDLIELFGERVQTTVKAALSPNRRVPFGLYGNTGTGGQMSMFYQGLDRLFGGSPGSGLNYQQLQGEPLENPTVAVCVDRIAQALQSAPPILQEKKGDTWEQVNEHPVLDLLNRPNPYYPPNHLWTTTVQSEVTRGQAFWQVVWNRGRTQPVELWWEKPESIVLISTEREFVASYAIQKGRAKVELKNDEIIHFRHSLNPNNPVTGWSPLMSAARQITGDNAAATYHSAILRNSGVLSLLISVKDATTSATVTPEQVSGFVDALSKKMRGDGAGGIAGLNIPLDVQKLAFSPDEMSLDSLIVYYQTLICAAIGVDPMVAGLGSGTEHRTYANMKEALKDFWERGIIPRQQRYSSELGIQLLPLFGLDPTRFRLASDYSNVPALQENEDERHTRAREDFKAQVIDLDEARVMLGLESKNEFQGKFFGGGGAAEEEPEEETVPAAKTWDESKHPRAEDGKFGSGANRSQGNKIPAMSTANDLPHGWRIEEKPGINIRTVENPPIGPDGKRRKEKFSIVREPGTKHEVYDSEGKQRGVKWSREEALELAQKEAAKDTPKTQQPREVVRHSDKRTPGTKLVARYSDDIDADIKRGWSAYQHPNYGGTRAEVLQDAEDMGIKDPEIRKIPQGGYALVHHDGLSSYPLNSEGVDEATLEAHSSAGFDGSGYGHSTIGKIRKMRTIPKELIGSLRDLHILEVEDSEVEQMMPMTKRSATKAAPAIDTTQPQDLAPWTDEELDAMTDNWSMEDVKEALGTRTKEMRALLEAKQEGEA
jgi:HK97 family phage portal protein